MSATPADVSSQLSNTSQLGGFQMPDTSELDQQIADERKTAEGFEQKSVAQTERAAGIEEQAAKQIQQQQHTFDSLLKQYPTRDVAYATAMHNAPMLSIMTALGGRLTRLNGMEMLGATTGIMAGLNKGAEEQFQESMAKWNAAYERQKDLFAQQQRANQLMLSAYAGRADAYQKAAEAARRMTGDLLDDKQNKIKQQIDLFKVQESIMAQAEKSREAWAKIADQRMKDTAQVRRWNAWLQTVTDPRIKAQMQANQRMWTNFKAQEDELLKRRGQISSNIDLKPQEKQVAIARIDDDLAQLTGKMNETAAEGERLALSSPTNIPSPPTSAPASTSGTGPGPTAGAPVNQPPQNGAPATYKTAQDVWNAVNVAHTLSPEAGQYILQHQFGMP